MGTIRVIAGDLKGKIIPFSGKKFNNAEITPQRVKEAVFSILGNDLRGFSFLDLYSCSGQIAIEALSRGASPVIINEIDKKRLSFIRSFINRCSIDSEIIFFNCRSDDLLKHLGKKEITLDYIYIDHPYVKVKGSVNKYNEIIGRIESSGLVSRRGAVIVQHFKGNILNERIGKLVRRDTRNYGSTAISIYG